MRTRRARISPSCTCGPPCHQLESARRFQIFFDGVYNTDPHAGNVLIMNDGRLGLVDYGAVGYVSVDQRTALAKLCIAIDNQDDDAT